MNDIEYMLKTDAREKKAAGRGIYHKRNGSRTSYVSLPSDNMTRAEWKRRNGPVLTFNTTRVIKDFATFKALPLDLAKRYIAALQLTYNVSMAQIAQTMAVNPRPLKNYCNEVGIRYSAKHGPRPEDPRWKLFVDGCATVDGFVDKDPCAPDLDPVANGLPEEPAAAEDTCTTEPIVVDDPFAPEPDPTAAPKSTASKLLFEASGTTEQLLDLLMSVFSDLTRVDKEYDIRVHLTEKGSDTA